MDKVPSSPDAFRRSQELHRPRETVEEKEQQGSTTTTAFLDYVPQLASYFWATVTRDYSGPQRAMSDYFANPDITPAQKIDHLVAQHRSLGLSGDALHAFIETLLCEGTVLKDEFRPIFTAITGFANLVEFTQALTQPTSVDGKRLLTALNEALRSDPAYLAGETAKVMQSRLPVEQKAVHLMLLLTLREVSDEQARACYSKLPEADQRFFSEEEVDLEAIDVKGLQGVVGSKISPLAVMEVMQSFQAQGFGITVTQLHQNLLHKDFHQPLLNLQVVVKEEKEKKKLQTEVLDLAASLAPKTAVQYKLFSFLGVEFNHFTACEHSKPCGDVATEALRRMIAETKKL